jgi:hypothetical protein
MRRTTLKQLQQRVRNLEKQLLDIQAYLGVLRPVFEREYLKGKWNWEGKKAPRKGRAQ